MILGIIFPIKALIETLWVGFSFIFRFTSWEFLSRLLSMALRPFRDSAMTKVCNEGEGGIRPFIGSVSYSHLECGPT